MSDAQIDKLFIPFSQADSSTTRKYGGTGLGLSIVKRLCQLMKGDITVQSFEGSGSEFCFTIELLESEEVVVKKVEEIKFTPLCKNKNKVLLVEDNKINQMVATKMLAEIDIIPDIADNGLIALEKLNQCDQSNPYSLVLMDCLMPELDGYQTTVAIRTGQGGFHHQGVIIIAMTANAMKGDREKCLDVGMNDYLSKPLSLDNIKKTLHSWMEKSIAVI